MERSVVRCMCCNGVRVERDGVARDSACEERETRPPPPNAPCHCHCSAHHHRLTVKRLVVRSAVRHASKRSVLLARKRVPSRVPPRRARCLGLVPPLRPRVVPHARGYRLRRVRRQWRTVCITESNDFHGPRRAVPWVHGDVPHPRLVVETSSQSVAHSGARDLRCSASLATSRRRWWRSGNGDRDGNGCGHRLGSSGATGQGPNSACSS